MGKVNGAVTHCKVGCAHEHMQKILPSTLPHEWRLRNTSVQIQSTIAVSSK